MSQTTNILKCRIPHIAIATSVLMLTAFTTKKENVSTKGDPEPSPWAWGDSDSEISQGSWVNSYPTPEATISATFFYSHVTKKYAVSALLGGCTFVASTDIPHNVKTEYGLSTANSAYLALACSGGVDTDTIQPAILVESELMQYFGWGANSNAAELIAATRRVAQMLNESLAFGATLELVAHEKDIDAETGDVVKLKWEQGFDCHAISFKAGRMDMTLLDAAAQP